VFLRSVRQLLVTANVLNSSILVTLMMEALCSFETSVLTRSTRINNPEEAILRSHRREDISMYVSIYLSMYWSIYLSCLSACPIPRGLLNNIIYRRTVGSLKHEERDKIWRETTTAWPNYCPHDCLEGLSESAANLRQRVRCPGLHLNRISPKRNLEYYL
jgi:hypothetical protein